MAEESSGLGYLPVPVILESSDDDPDLNSRRRCRLLLSPDSSEPEPGQLVTSSAGSDGDDRSVGDLAGDSETRMLLGDQSPQPEIRGHVAASSSVGASSHLVEDDSAMALSELEAAVAAVTQLGPMGSSHTSCRGEKEADEGQGQAQENSSVEELLFPGFVPITFYCLPQTHLVRFWCLRCITWPWFERISMFVIILNCVTLGMYQPCSDESCSTIRCQLLEGFDHFIFAFFSIEMLIKMIAMGVIGKDTYLADSWNRLDCFIVLAGTIEYAIDTENLSLSAIRTIRVLRPLRAINRIPSMRILVMLLLDTLPMLGNVLLLCFFVFFIFGIIGVQLWSGVLRQRCFLDLNESYGRPEYVAQFYKSKVEFICSPRDSAGLKKCENLPNYEYEGIRCNASAKMYSNNTPTNESCVNWNQYYTNCTPHAPNPFMGSVSFDNIGLAWVVIFQVISLESWVNIMYHIQDAHSFWDWIYFVALIVIGSFFMINLCLVVIATQFSETKKREMERMLQERKRFQSCSTLASNSEPGGCYTELLKLLVHLYRRAARKVVKAYHKTRGVKKFQSEKTLSLRSKKTTKKGTNRIASQNHIVPQYQPHHHHQTQPTAQYLLAPTPQPSQLPYSNLVTPDPRYQSPPRPSSIPQAPRASPEQSDIDSMSSPHRPHYLVLPGASYSLAPSWDSLATSHFSVDPFITPVLPKSHNSSTNQLSSSFGLALAVPLSRAHSCYSSASSGGRVNPTLPEVLAAQGAKNAALVASNMLLGTDCDTRKAQSVADKGLFADNLLMDMVAEKQLACQYPTQNDVNLHQLEQAPGTGGVSVEFRVADKDYSGEQAVISNTILVPSVVIVSGGDSGDYDSNKVEPIQTSRLGSVIESIKALQRKLPEWAEGNLFNRSIQIAILLNTLSMGVEYHEQPTWLTLTLEYSNIFFCVLFVCEMALKICAYGLFGYISSGFNVFEGFIVILSIVELAQGGASGLSVLRTFRLLRILKLVRSMPALRRQLVVMLRTMDNVATFFALLVLFMFIFSILGMNLFGGTFCEKEDGTYCSCQDRLNASIGCRCDRANFDNLLWSLVTVFQVLTQEDWNTVLYNGMARTSPWASLYFIALMTFGNYVLFNLLVAILVEGFSTEDEEKKKDKLKDIDNEDKDEDDEEDEDEEEIKEKKRLAENNNIDDVQSIKSRLNSLDLDVKNNQEKEKKMLALPVPPGLMPKNENLPYLQTLVPPDGPLNPPIITHTAATPMATPQGSPNDSGLKNTNHRLSLCAKRSALKSTLSMDSDKPIYRGGSPRPSPIIHGATMKAGHHQRSASWRLRDRHLIGDRLNLVVDSFSDSADEVEDDVFSSSHSQSPTYSAGTPRAPSINTHGDCNGHPPLNNQRTLSPQNSLKGRSLTPHNGRSLTPRNSFRSQHVWSRNNSVGSRRSLYNSFELSRQNSFTSHRTVNSLGSGNSKDDYKANKNFVDMPDVKIALDKEEGREEEVEDLADPDAIDETDWNCSWCPEPRGCFLTRHEYAFYLLSNENKIRCCAHYLISRAWFDNAVLVFIALNCITLAMERPNIPPDSHERTFLTYSNYIFTFVFTLEMMIKVVAKGFFVGKHAYLKSGWNVMDGFLVMISLIDIFISLSASSSPRIFGILRVFRLLRTLRPLRVINRAPGLKLVVQTLLSSLRPIGNIVLICCTFFAIFAILGVQLFKGTFYHCKGPNVTNVVTRADCEESNKNNKWVNHKYNFDNMGQALMALFVLASKDGWVQIMYTGLDAVGIDLQPKENYNEWRLIYFISFLLLVAFFVLNMFVGVVVENFHKCRESQEIEERAKRAAKRQEKLDKKRKKMREPPYWANYSHARLLIHTVINSKYFDLAIAAVIGLNVITMAMEYHMMPDELDFALKIFNFFFTSVFILEALMKIVALGFYRYIKDRWNQLDIMIVILSIVGIVLEEMKSNVIRINPTIIRVMRVLRIARVLKLLKMAKGIRALLDTVIQALPQVGNLGLLFFLLFFIFAALGVELFGRLECDEIKNPCEGLGVHAHFKNFGMAFLTLFRVATGDNWNGIMKDTLREDCDKSDNCLNNCCVSHLIAPVYFVVFVLMAQFVLVNVVVAVLMKHLEESHKMIDEDTMLLRDAVISSVNSRQDFQTRDSELDKDSIAIVSNVMPSFSFCVRPPSEEQSRSEDMPGNSPMNASLAVEGLASSWSSMDSHHLTATPSMTGSSPCSEQSARISSPPIRRAVSPYLLSLQGQSGSLQRRPLVKQYSMDVGSDPQLHNPKPAPNDAWEKLQGSQVTQRPTDNNFSRSQPSLKDMANEGKGSFDSKEGSTGSDRLPARDRIKHRLLRSRSSGAKYSRFRDKYKQSNLNRAAKAEQPEGGGPQDKCKKISQPSSNETGSDVDESVISDWGSEEAACDLEVKMITGGTEDEEDDIHPTLSPYTSEDRESAHLESYMRGLLDSALSGESQSTCRGDSTPRAMKPPLTKSRTSVSQTNPGIDNTSFELGEDIRIPPCCKARETAAVKRSNSFSPSKLTPKAFSPPMLLSPRSDRSLSPFGHREYTTAVSPLALEDSAYKMNLSPHSARDGPISPVSSAYTLTVPYPHAFQTHLMEHQRDSRQPTICHSQHSVDHHTPLTVSPLRRRIPHTLSMDSAFLMPTGQQSSFHLNDPYLELHAGCRAASPLPSPRNSQQTLPSMFTRSTSSSVPYHWHTTAQPQANVPTLSSSMAATDSSTASPESSPTQCLSLPVPPSSSSLHSKSAEKPLTSHEEDLISLVGSLPNTASTCQEETLTAQIHQKNGSSDS